MLVGNVRGPGLTVGRQTSARIAPDSGLAEARARQSLLPGDNGNDDKSPFIERTAQLREILKRIEASKPDMAAERRAAAKQKIDGIRKRLQMLRQMLASDPKSIARQAASLARELAAAVKEYAAAGGTDGGGTSAPPAASPAQPNASPGEGGVEANLPGTTGQGPAGQAVSIDATSAQVTAATAPPPDANAGVAPETEAEPPASAEDNGEIGPQTAPQTTAASSSVAASQAALKLAEKANRQREDEEFTQLSRLLVAGLRSLMRQAAAKTPEKTGAAPQDSAQAEAALRVAESSLQGIRAAA